MSEDRLNQMQWCSEELMNTREELDQSRKINSHLNNVLDKQKNQLDGIRNIIRQVCTGKITEEMGMNDVKVKMEWKR